MRLSIVCVLAVAATLFVGVSAAETAVIYRSVPVSAVRVVDGDTLRATLTVAPGVVVTPPNGLRLLGVDTPEMRGVPACEKTLAQQATAFTADWLAQGPFDVASDGGADAFGRWLVSASRGGESLADALIASGLGRQFVPGNHTPWC